MAHIYVQGEGRNPLSSRTVLLETGLLLMTSEFLPFLAYDCFLCISLDGAELPGPVLHTRLPPTRSCPELGDHHSGMGTKGVEAGSLSGEPSMAKVLMVIFCLVSFQQRVE